MGSSVQRTSPHRRLLAGRWLPLSIFDLDRELGYEPDMLDGLQVRKRGLTDALAEEGLLTLPPRQQDILDALFWQRATVLQVGRQLAGVDLDEHQADLAGLVWEQWHDDKAGTAAYMRARIPGWRPPPEPAPAGRRPQNGVHHEEVRRARADALRRLREWCDKWVATELLAAEVDEALEAS